MRFKTVVLLALSFAPFANAQTYFTANGFGDLVAGFRKTGTFVEQSELVVNLGNITNYLKLSIGATVDITNYSHLQITNMCPDDLANLQWSAFSTFQPIGFPEGPWVTPIGSFPKATCWYTLPRTDPSVPTAPPSRSAYNGLTLLRSHILGVNKGAVSISQSLVTTNAFNNTRLVTEPVSYAADGTLTTAIGDASDPSFGDFGGQTFNYSVENTTLDPFTSPQISDFYQVCPSGYADPLSHLTNGTAYYVGYFTLAVDGTMTFTRDVQTTTHNPPPPPSQLSVTVGASPTAGTNLISFLTTNGATYTLFFTNGAGLNSPVSTWPSLGGTISGDGGIKSFIDIVAPGEVDRFYRIGAR